MREISLTQGRVTLVDDEDYEELVQYNCQYQPVYTDKSKGYAKRTTYKNGKFKTIRMHRLIMKAGVDDTIEHKDNDGLNNQKENLRICKQADNVRNRRSCTKDTKGCMKTAYGSWQVAIGFKKKRYNVGNFKVVEDACYAYGFVAQFLHGEFACVNSKENLMNNAEKQKYLKDLGNHLHDLVETHAKWSDSQFGDKTQRDSIGPVKHLIKECNEILESPNDPTEYADAFLLLIDAARRAGISIGDLISHAKNKLTVNRSRKWKVALNGEACEHLKEEND